MSPIETGTEGKRIRAREGKYLTFRLGDEEYGLEILKVQEIIQLQAVTRVPHTPNYIRGVINLRGKVIPVVELRAKFGLPSQEDTEKTCIIVVEVESEAGSMTMSIVIDEVREVQDIKEADLEAPPNFGHEVHTDFLLGMGKVGGRVKLLLDIDRIVSGEEAAELHQLAQ